MKNDKPGSKKDSKSKTSPDTKWDPRSDSETRPKKEHKSGLNSATRREQRLELESTLKKDFRAKAGKKTVSKRDSKPDVDDSPKKEYGVKSAPRAKREGSFSPETASNKRPSSEKRAAKPDSRDKPERGATQAFPAKRYINVYLSLGSNMGDRRANLGHAAYLIDQNIGKIAKKSGIYETEPWGNAPQDLYLNQVLMINTTLDPRDLLEGITHIENELGRVRTEKWGPRTIDIDIIFYGKRIVRDKGLEIPHPEMHKRSFVLVPLMEIAPELEHPVLKQPIDELYMSSKDPSEVVMID